MQPRPHATRPQAAVLAVRTRLLLGEQPHVCEGPVLRALRWKGGKRGRRRVLHICACARACRPTTEVLACPGAGLHAGPALPPPHANAVPPPHLAEERREVLLSAGRHRRDVEHRLVVRCLERRHGAAAAVVGVVRRRRRGRQRRRRAVGAGRGVCARRGARRGRVKGDWVVVCELGSTLPSYTCIGQPQAHAVAPRRPMHSMRVVCHATSAAFFLSRLAQHSHDPLTRVFQDRLVLVPATRERRSVHVHGDGLGNRSAKKGPSCLSSTRQQTARENFFLRLTQPGLLCRTSHS